MQLKAKQISSKQSRQARSLLKWNHHDVIGKCTLRLQRLDHFERGILRLTRPENDELVKVYVDHGIYFSGDGEVKLLKEEVLKQRTKVDTAQDMIQDIDEMRELEYQATKPEKIDVDEETSKDFMNRVRLLIDVKK